MTLRPASVFCHPVIDALGKIGIVLVSSFHAASFVGEGNAKQFNVTRDYIPFLL
jgi:hypothetical protein